MKVIRTIVVDDEPYIRKSIVKSIEAANPFFSVVAEAGDGLVALEMIKEQSPDVVFIDINMPLMDGVELIQRINLLDKVPVCVILSGYSDFKYAQAAIQYHVHDYLLKPIAPSELKAVLTLIQKRILDSVRENQYLYFDHLLRGRKLNLTSDEIMYCFSQYKVFYPFIINLGSYMISKNNQFSLLDDSNYKAYLETLWTRIGATNASQWILSGENSNEQIVIIGYEFEVSIKMQRELIINYYNELLKYNIPVTLITGNPTHNIHSLVPNIIDIKYEYPSIIKYGYSTLSSYQNKPEVDSGHVNFTSETLKLLRNLRDTENKYEYLQLTRAILVNCKEKQVPQILLQSISKHILFLASNEIYSLDNDSFVDELITNTYSYDIYIIEYIKLLSQIIGYSQTECSGDAINSIKTYIDEYFTEEISLKLLSNKFHISISHFSVQFKKRFHISPNEYIINKRIERAKMLLQITPPLSIKQVSGMVGYMDPYYFSRIFKSINGLSPTDYQTNFHGMDE